MGIYTGSKCIACGKAFEDSDDVVVCPDCGTPYHRECYQANGKCINDKLHEAGLSWQEENKPASVTPAKTVRCIRCGAENPADEHICRQCGTPLVNMESVRPFNEPLGQSSEYGGQNSINDDNQPNYGAVMFNQDSEIDGVRLGDYARYIGTNPVGFLPNFIRFGKFGRKLSLNLFAFLFTSVYFMYRKMMGWGILAIIVTALLGVPDMIYVLQTGSSGYKIDLGIDIKSQSFIAVYNAVLYITILVKILAGVFANYLYYRQARRDITEIRSNNSLNEDDNVVKRTIMMRGGISWGNVILGYMLYTIISIGAVLLVSKFA